MQQRAREHRSSAGRRRASAAGPVASGDRHILLALGWYYPEIHRGVARFARDRHWHLTCDFDDPVPRHWDGDGVLTLLGARRDMWRNLRRRTMPIVDLAESRPEIRLPRVTMDNAAIGRMAAGYFLGRGYRHFAFVQRWDLGVSRRRLEHFRAAVEAEGYRCEVLSWPGERGRRPDSREHRHRWLIRRLSGLPGPLAVFARDTEAAEVIEACSSADLVVPDRVAVLGVDNTETICECLRVPLSSIDNRLERLGYEGAALLERLMGGEAAPTSPVYISPAGIVERRSTDSLAVDHPRVAAALRFIHDHADRSIGMADVVRHVAMSRSGLEKAFREHYVRAPMEELRHVRLTRAGRMLRETDEAIATIARRTGFQSHQNLCRTFARTFGLSPKRYRVSSRGEAGPAG